MLNIKFFCVFLGVTTLLNGVYCTDGKSNNRIFEPQINQTLEMIKELFKEGNEELGIPPLDPLTIKLLNFPVYINEVIDVNISASDILTTGISSFIATKLKFNPLTMKLDYTILVPKIIVDGLYNLNGIVIQFIPAYGNGSFGSELSNLELSGHVQVSLLSTRLSVKDVKLLISLEDIQFSLTGLMDNEIFSQSLVNTLNEHVGPIINTYKEEISQIVSPILKEIFNYILHPIMN